MAEFAELIKSRRSIHVWEDKPVPEELLMQAVELATWAPNGGNQQNWYFYIILNRDMINAIADAPQELREYIATWPEMAQSGASQGPPRPGGGLPPAGRRDTLRAAPALIAVANRRTRNQFHEIITERGKTDPRARQIMDGLNAIGSRVQSVSAAVAYLLLALHQMGLGAVWMVGPMQAKAGIEKALNVPEDLDIVALVPVGYPAESPVKDRKPVSEVSEVIR